MALKMSCNWILELLGSQVITELSGYKEIELCMMGGVVVVYKRPKLTKGGSDMKSTRKY